LAAFATACTAGTSEGAGRSSSPDSVVSFVQLNYATPQDPSSSVSVVYLKPQQAGDLNVVVVGWDDTSSSIVSITDSNNGASYGVAVPTTRSSSNSQAIYYLPAIQAAPANSVTVTVVFDGPAAFPDVRIAEYSGLSGTLETAPAAATGTDPVASAGPIAVTAPPDLVFAAGTTTNTFGSPGVFFTERVLTQPDGDIVQDRIAGAPGPYTATAPCGGEWVMQAVAFQSAPSPVDSGAPGDSASDGGADETEGGPDSSSDSPSTEGGPAGNPTLVQHDSSSSTRLAGLGDVGPFCYYFELPNFTTAGNAVVVGFTFMGNPVPTVSDDQGNGYQIVHTFFDDADNQSVGIAAAFDVTAGARNISLCFDGDPGGRIQPMATEFANVVGVDGPASAASGSGTVASPGTMTPTASGDLVYQIAVALSGSQASFTAGTDANISGGLLSADLVDGWAAQYGVDSAPDPIAPALGLGSSDTWISAAVLLKPGPSGGVPPGLRIVHLVHENLPFTEPAGGNGIEFPSPLTLQFPSSGNLLVAMEGGGGTAGQWRTLDGMSDTNGNAWTQAGASSTSYVSGDTIVQAYYAANVVPSSDLLLTTTWSAVDPTNPADLTILLYDIAGASSDPFDQVQGGTAESGLEQIPPDVPMPFNVIPSVPNELILVEACWDNNTGNALLGGMFDANLVTGESISGPFPIDENNGWGHFVTMSTSEVDFTWTTSTIDQGVGPGYSAIAVAFKAAGP
jgi:hypothetical protein